MHPSGDDDMIGGDDRSERARWSRTRAAAAGIVALVAVGALVGSTATENTPRRVEGAAGTAGTTAGTARTVGTVPVFAVGEAVELGDWTVRVNEVLDPFLSAVELGTPAPGNRRLVVDVTVENLSRRPELVSAVACFELEDLDGRRYRSAFQPDAPSPALDGEVDPGGRRSGTLAYEVPESVTELRLRFRCEAFSRGTAIISLS